MKTWQNWTDALPFPQANGPIGLGVAGAILGWLIKRSRKPAPVPTRR